jgi:8-oxo-dGTP pyrophosphatase MutT (NUDIX family)
MESMDTGQGVKGMVLRGDKFLVLLKPDGECDLPGGRIEGGEGSKEGLVREIWEETGLGDVAISDLFGRWELRNRSGRIISGTTWLCQYKGGGDVHLSDEHSGFSWEPVDHLKELDVYRKFGLDKLSPSLNRTIPR